MHIIKSIKDENLFQPFLGDLTSWRNWLRALRVLYGLPIRNQKSKKLIKDCTGRILESLPNEGFQTALFLTGRRSGKSRISAIIAAFEAVLAGHEKKLSRGETGVIPVISPTRYQSRIVQKYIRAIFDTPMLKNEVVREDRNSFELRNGNIIEILAGDWRTVRGYTLIAAVIDEAAFFGFDVESKVKSDTELIRAIQPSLVTVGGKLIVISTPYARKGWCWNQYRKNFGNDKGNNLIWNCSSRTMNPKLPQKVIDDAMAEDMAAAKAEYLGEFRDDVAEFLPRSVIESVVVDGRKELLPRDDIDYCGFVDVSGGRVDDSALSIAHKKDETVIVDFVKRWKSPHNPNDVIAQMCEILKRFDVQQVTGDNYSAEFVSSSFQSNGISYQKSEKNKSQLYLELLPRLCSGEVELLDNDLLITQLATLERRTRSGGKDIIDHPPKCHDDLANSCAGVVVVSAKPVFVAGAIELDF